MSLTLSVVSGAIRRWGGVLPGSSPGGVSWRVWLYVDFQSPRRLGVVGCHIALQKVTRVNDTKTERGTLVRTGPSVKITTVVGDGRI